MIKVITNVKSSRKSYILFNIYCEYLKQKGIDNDHIIKITFNIIEYNYLREPHTLYNYILLDEIQHVPKKLSTQLKYNNSKQ